MGSSLCGCVDTALAQGVLLNGWMHTGAIFPVGDSDVWTFAASAGDRIILRVGEISQTNAFTPRMRLINPVAVQQASASGALDAEIAVTATNTGTFTVIVDDAVGTTATGTYRLTLAMSPGAVMVSPGDEGGPLVNGFQHAGTINVGDLDVWTFSANAGDAIVLRMGSVGFNPWIRLFGPTGVMVGQAVDGSNGVRDADLRVQATNRGPYTVVVGGLYQNGNGPYILTLAHLPGKIGVAPGDEGGSSETNGFVVIGTINVGDLDVWSFQACQGNLLSFRCQELTGGVSFSPRLRLFGPTGQLLVSLVHATTVTINYQTTNVGVYTLIVDGGLFNHTGTYTLTGSGFVEEGLRLCLPDVAGTVAHVSGVGGTPGADFVLLTTSTLDPPIDWMPIHTNRFDVNGVFEHTHPLLPGEKRRFYNLFEE